MLGTLGTDREQFGVNLLKKKFPGKKSGARVGIGSTREKYKMDGSRKGG